MDYLGYFLNSSCVLTFDLLLFTNLQKVEKKIGKRNNLNLSLTASVDSYITSVMGTAFYIQKQKELN